MTDSLLALKKENVELRRIILKVASALYETEGVTGAAASSITLIIIDGYKQITQAEERKNV